MFASRCFAFLIGIQTLLPFRNASVFASTVVDLSQPWEEAPSYNNNEAYCAIQAVMAPLTRGYVVIKNGLLVAEGYTTGNEQNGIYEAWSVTKSWSSMIFGKMVDLQQVSVSETLGAIFDQEEDWVGVSQATEKKTVTLEELLNFSGGLVGAEDCIFLKTEQANLTEVLNCVDYREDQVGIFNYLSFQQTLSRIILRRSGLTPREFMQQTGIFDKLGISESDYEWESFGGVEGTAYGLSTQVRVLAKLGQLYLQKGLAGEADQLIPTEFIEASTSDLLSDDTQSIQPLFLGYGYHWYVDRKFRDNLFVPVKNLEGGYMANGLDGQMIVVVPRLDIVIAIMSDDPFLQIYTTVFLVVIAENLDKLDQEVTSDNCGEFSFMALAQRGGYALVRSTLAILSNRFLE